MKTFEKERKQNYITIIVLAILFIFPHYTYAQKLYMNNEFKIKAKNNSSKEVYIAKLTYVKGLIYDDIIVEGWYIIKPYSSGLIFDGNEGSMTIAIAVAVYKNNKFSIVDFKPSKTRYVKYENDFVMKTPIDNFNYKVNVLGKITPTQWDNLDGEPVHFTISIYNPSDMYENIDRTITLDLSNAHYASTLEILENQQSKSFAKNNAVFKEQLKKIIKQRKEQKAKNKEKKTKDFSYGELAKSVGKIINYKNLKDSKTPIIYSSKTNKKRKKIKDLDCYNYFNIPAKLNYEKRKKSKYQKYSITLFDNITTHAFEYIYIDFNNIKLMKSIWGNNYLTNLKTIKNTRYDFSLFDSDDTLIKKYVKKNINFCICESNIKIKKDSSKFSSDLRTFVKINLTSIKTNE